MVLFKYEQMLLMTSVIVFIDKDNTQNILSICIHGIYST